jgi:hypothetical protein
MSTTTEVSLKDRRAELEARAAKLAEEIASFVDRIDAGETLTSEQSERFERQTAAVNRLQGQIEEVRELQLAEIRHLQPFRDTSSRVTVLPRIPRCSMRCVAVATRGSSPSCVHRRRSVMTPSPTAGQRN